ncbi:hypothetical protein I4U23_029339 [Adineta vaga]|nr:hypothetical protein I4U23_029339 [Adineta vaga]
MCTDIDYLPQMMILTEKEFRLMNNYDRRNSWTPSVTSSSSSSTTNTISTNTTSWIDRKLFSHLKRFFRRSPTTSQSNSLTSSRRPSSLGEEALSLSINDQSKQTNENEGDETAIVENKCYENVSTPFSSPSFSSSSPSESISTPASKQESLLADHSNSVDLLYDYDRLLARCLQRQEHDLTEMITLCQSPVTIPHADLIVGQSRSIVVNWKSYIRLSRALNRDPSLFQQYVSQHYGCQSSVNQREQLTFNTRTTRTTFDNVLKTYLDKYVTCLACQKARTHLIKSTGLWRIECQLCGSQRSVKRLRWNRHNKHS